MMLSKIENQNREAVRSYSENIIAASKTTTNKTDFNPDAMLAELSKSQTSIFSQTTSVIGDLFRSIMPRFESPKIETKATSSNLVSEINKTLLTRVDRDQRVSTGSFIEELNKSIITKVDKVNVTNMEKQYVEVKNKAKDIFSSIVDTSGLASSDRELS